MKTKTDCKGNTHPVKKINLQLFQAFDPQEVREYFRCQCSPHCHAEFLDFELYLHICRIATLFMYRPDGTPSTKDYQMEIVLACACKNVKAHRKYRIGRAVKFRIYEEGNLMDHNKLAAQLRSFGIPAKFMDDLIEVDSTQHIIAVPPPREEPTVITAPEKKLII